MSNRYNQPPEGSTDWDTSLNQNFSDLEIEVTETVEAWADLPDMSSVEQSSNGQWPVFRVAADDVFVEVTNEAVSIVGGLGSDTRPLPESHHDSILTGDVTSSDQPVRDVTHPVYGAVGDGETDDTAAVQSALEEGGIVWIPHGHTFLVEQLGTDTSDVIIDGGGTIKLTDEDVSADWVVRLGGDRSQLRNVTIDPSGDTTANSGRNEGVRLEGDECVVQNVRILSTANQGEANGDLANSLYIRGTDTVVRDLYAEGAARGAIRMRKPFSVDGLIAKQCKRGISGTVNEAGTTIISNCHIDVEDIDDDGLSMGLDIRGQDTSDPEKNALFATNVEIRGDCQDNSVMKAPYHEYQYWVNIDQDVETTPSYSVHEQGDTELVYMNNCRLQGRAKLDQTGGGGKIVLSNCEIVSTDRDGLDIDCASGVHSVVENCYVESTNNPFHYEGTGTVTIRDCHAHVTGDWGNYNYPENGHPYPGAVRIENPTASGPISPEAYNVEKTVLNGYALNNGDPNETGTWNQNEIPGVTVIDTNTGDQYVYRDGSWY